MKNGLKCFGGDKNHIWVNLGLPTTVRPCDTLSSVLLKHSVPQNSIPQG